MCVLDIVAICLLWGWADRRTVRPSARGILRCRRSGSLRVSLLLRCICGLVVVGILTEDLLLLLCEMRLRIADASHADGLRWVYRCHGGAALLCLLVLPAAEAEPDESDDQGEADDRPDNDSGDPGFGTLLLGCVC